MSFDLAAPLIASAINLRKVAPPHFNLLRGLGAGADLVRFPDPPHPKGLFINDVITGGGGGG